MIRLSIVLWTTVLLAAPVLADDTDARIEASRNAAMKLQSTLLAELQSAMKEGGPPNAIKVCNTRAPAIAKEISGAGNLRIGRTSLKVRNTNNAPDAWEKKVLESFEARKAAGEDPAKLEHHEVVGKEFRYMKAIAIPANMPCLKCHGEQLDPAVQAKLKELYPNDKATGYKTGDLRGAFTITQPR
ncbi:MAG: DUF3365 domain-containing protein [Gammaproteobacteria bacterium]|nr:DUF3365 domain-containing protein [Gammaproteobacteria bacterium]MDH3369828.1 DUF3365 domain-containing protein [Gammaproteobacteria bacterium]MDH3562364.1 DUF3365 domain-containing protein [Gammaproteobacteria bacterium]MDH5487274.1 DUF3365 domain-containing protein [Gammaproteobacteria bacterium]